jgi:hypothetical protein
LYSFDEKGGEKEEYIYQMERKGGKKEGVWRKAGV